MQKIERTDYSFKIYEAIVIGIILSFALQWTNASQAIPLFDFFPEFISGKLVPYLMTSIWFLTLFEKKYFKTLVGLIFTVMFLVSIFRYSSNFAFRYFTLYIVVFIYVFNNKDKRQRAIGSSLILASLFIFSAFHKLNDDYLSGVEFERGGTFIGFFDLWFPGISPQKLGSLLKFLPVFSIAVEFIIAFGLILKPKLFIHIAGIFLLALCILNPPVLSVYFMLLPLFISVSSGYVNLLKNMPFYALLKTPYFWAFYIYVSTTKIYELSFIIMTNYVLVFIFVVAHAAIILKYKNEKIILLEYEKRDFKKLRVWIIPTLMCLTFIGSLFILPSPFGFKMFSGRRFETTYLTMTINQQGACHFASHRWQYSPVADVKWVRLDGDSCQILLPTPGSVSYVARHLCGNYDRLEFSVSNSRGGPATEMDCSNFTERIFSISP